MDSKPIYKSREVWIGAIAFLNYILSAFGLPSVEPTPELLTAMIGLMVAVRVFLTEAKISISNS